MNASPILIPCFPDALPVNPLQYTGTCTVDTVPYNDPRKQLRGQKRLLAAKDMEPGNIVLPYQVWRAGILMSGSESSFSNG